MKISLITVTWNAEEFISDCIDSVLNQSYNDIEYIIIDGNSSDKTLSIIKSYQNKIQKVISEKDKGIYDAMNKGIALATGDIVGILNADDFFATQYVLENIAKTFTETKAGIVYGDLWYVDRADINIVKRKWKSAAYKEGMFQLGWMPAHPTFYAKRELFEHFGNYDLNYGSAADYELMQRFLHKHKVKAAYIPEVIVKMRTGGVSNSSFQNRLKASKADLAAMRSNGLQFPLLAAFLKPVRKIPQFLNL